MTTYGAAFFDHEADYSSRAAKIILAYLSDKLNINSMVDFGCGVGKWLLAAKEIGISNVFGLDGVYTEQYKVVSDDEFMGCDLNEKIDLNKRFDLAISLEVAEHLAKKSAKTFIGNMVRHADIILFGAAVPYQGGNTHINEQYPSYWQEIFAEYGYEYCDCIRGQFWNDDRVAYFYKQDTYLYYKKELKEKIESVFQHSNGIIQPAIHPELWERAHYYEYVFPFDQVERNEKVVIFGTGRVGQAFYRQLTHTQYAKVCLWVDSQFDKYANSEVRISPISDIKNVEYDKVIVAAEGEKVAKEIRQLLIEREVDGDKIIWNNPVTRVIHL